MPYFFPLFELKIKGGGGEGYQLHDHQQLQWTNSSALMHILACDRQPCGSITSLPHNEIQNYITGLTGSSPETQGQEEGGGDGEDAIKKNCTK